MQIESVLNGEKRQRGSYLLSFEADTNNTKSARKMLQAFWSDLLKSD